MILPDTFQAASDEMPAAADPANQSHCFFFYRGSLLVRQDAIAASQRLAHKQRSAIKKETMALISRVG
ncbi:MAG: hypothetical protein EBX67_09245, partial [Betaproteobacteria bacterium]|nr:hypothetical protein [Betaproteobacteria bacterium]